MEDMNIAIAALRKEQGVTQADLADYLGITYQSVSKWENGVTLPDVTLLPKIASYFGVSINEVLGVPLPASQDYQPRPEATGQFWAKNAAYLNRTRQAMWNDDYLAFLVEKVWQIHEAIDIVDFGCGIGFLGRKLLPLLPKGSTYTGVYTGADLVKEAEGWFNDHGYEATFMTSSDTVLDGSKPFDLAICQAFLRHVRRPQSHVKDMIKVLKPGGLLVGIEVNRAFEVAGLYMDGQAYAPWEEMNLISKLWTKELFMEERDHAIGIRLPVLMDQVGLEGIDVRINDRVGLFHNQVTEDLETLAQLKGWRTDPISSREKRDQLNFLVSRGMAIEEASAFVELRKGQGDHWQETGKSRLAVHCLGLVISSGRKPLSD